MGTSGTYNYNPALAALTIEAYARIQIRPASLTADHMAQARASTNYLLSDWSVRGGPNLWEVDLISWPLVQGTYAYDVPGV